jgi:hypothetical protein
MKKTLTFQVAALKPRNVLALLARRRTAGKHATDKRSRNNEQKDLVQRFREAGLC